MLKQELLVRFLRLCQKALLALRILFLLLALIFVGPLWLFRFRAETVRVSPLFGRTSR
jgi:hypothetical protein